MKKFLALILALAMLMSFAACAKDEGDGSNTSDTTAADISEEVTEEAEVETEPTTEAEPVTKTEIVEVTNAEGEAVTNAEGEAVTEAVTVVVTTEAPELAIKEAPKDTAGIIELYNNTINDAYAKRVGFHKERWTDNETLNAGFLLKTFGDLIYSFMGIGAENKYVMDVTKGKWESDVPHHYLRKSTLTASDVTAAKCTESNGQYTIVLNVKPGSSRGAKSGEFNNSPIDKCGICVGDADKSYFDHKTGPVIYSAIGEVLSGAVIDESYDNAVVKAVIDAKTGHLVSFTVEYDIDVVIDAVGGGNATGDTHIKYTKFVY